MPRTSRRLRNSCLVLAAAGGLLLASHPPGMAADAVPGVQIAEVGGQRVVDGQVPETVSGAVDVTGTANPAQPPNPKPLVADAGDSAFVAVGDRAVLLGTGYGGSGRYEFAWSAEHGKLVDPQASSTELDTDGVEPGTYPVTVKVTDTAGNTATDTVKVVVYRAATLTLLDETKPDATPGTVASGETVDFTVDVPATQRELTVDMSFGEAANDYDLEVRDP
ncbi:MAG: hypothetical protein ACRDQB_15220, partial [Thermocrispum sp.]